jgi:hypothetical protein
MGADLYIKNQPRQAQYTGFRTDINVGYFRDAYNISNLLWQYGLSYWQDVKKLENKQGEITVTKIKKFQAILQEKRAVFEQNMKDVLEKGTNLVFEKNSMAGEDWKPMDEKERKEWYDFFIEHNDDLSAFLQKAIDMKSPILASL